MYRIEIPTNCWNEVVGGEEVVVGKTKTKRQPILLFQVLPLVSACFVMAELSWSWDAAQVGHVVLYWRGSIKDPAALSASSPSKYVKNSTRETLQCHMLYWSARSVLFYEILKNNYLYVALSEARKCWSHPQQQQQLREQPPRRKWWGEEQKVANTEVLKADSKNTRKLFENLSAINATIIL